MPTRRQALIGLGAAATTLTITPGFAGAHDRNRLVVVLLRGALDGLAAVPAPGDPYYERARAGLALPPPGEANGSLRLDDTFAFHPSLRHLYRRYMAGEVAVLHAIATPYRDRSHFDGQDALEAGTINAQTVRDGWLNRALQLLPVSPIGPANHGIALAQAAPLILRGSAPVLTWAPSALPVSDADTLDRVADLYRDDALLGPALKKALAARNVATSAMPAGMAQRAAGQGRQRFEILARAAGAFLAADDGPLVAVVEYGGWDTHANQGTTEGRMTRQLAGLDAGLEAMAEALGPAWSKTAVIVLTEFGRTVAQNGTHGTDHGTAGIHLIVGGAVNGGRVLTDWPGLAPAALFEGRDLRPTLDARASCKALLRDHLGIDERRLATTVFPNSGAVRPTDGLLRDPF